MQEADTDFDAGAEADSGFDRELWRKIVAERAIQRVLSEYGRGVDERDFERVRRCFHPDATITYGNEPTRTRDETITWLSQVLPAIFGLSHYFGPPIIDVSADGRSATCQTWCINVNQYPRGKNGAERQTASGLLYEDRFELRESGWLIAERRNHTEWNLEVDGNTRLPPA